MLLKPLAVLLAAGSMLVACAWSQDMQEMNDKASALTKLTAHVDAAVMFSPDGRAQADQVLFEKTFADNPTLKPYLAKDTLRLLRSERSVVVLVCTPDASVAWLEDLSCTAGVDMHPWRDKPPRQCAFTLDAATCP